MDARRVGDVADDLVGVEIDDGDVRPVRDVQPPRRAVDREVVPAAFAADLDLADDVIAGRRGGERGGGGEGVETGVERSSHVVLLNAYGSEL